MANNTIGEKELKRDWPCVTGLDADSKHEGRVENLKATEGSLVSRKEKVLMSGL